MPKTMSASQGNAHQFERGTDAAQQSDANRIGDLEERLKGMQQALDWDFERLADMQMKLSRQLRRK